MNFSPELKYCRSCWRRERHSPLKLGVVGNFVAVFITLGLAIPFWPYRCRCCGKTRVRVTLHDPPGDFH